MRAEVKIGIAVGVIVAIVAVLYVVFHEAGSKSSQVADANVGSSQMHPVAPAGSAGSETIVPAFGGRGPAPAADARPPAGPAGVSDLVPGVDRPVDVAATPPAATQPAAPPAAVQATSPLAVRPAMMPTTAPAAVAAARPGLAPAAGTTTYVVQKGDMGFWSIAEKVYGKGKGKYWTLIEKANPNVDSNRLAEGTVLKIPPVPGMPVAATATPTSTTPTVVVPAPGEKIYTVQSNDSWWEISRKQYGDGKYHEALRKANTHVTTLQPGQKIRIPPVGSLTVAGAAATRPAAPTTPTPPPADDRPAFD